MGQYYKPVNLDKKEWLYTHDFKTRHTFDNGKSFTCGEGLKLMEHSYIGNKVMNAVEHLLMPSGSWHRNRIVWAGDYADTEPGMGEQNINSIMESSGEKIHPTSKRVPLSYRYIVNHDKRLYIDKTKLEEDEHGMIIHPLSLFTCEGNGRGGGDFHYTDERIGTWARDHISVEQEAPFSYDEIHGQFFFINPFIESLS